MDKRGRWVQVPDIPLPSVDIDAHPKVGIFVSREWKEALLSLVQHADQLVTWESDDADRIEQNAFNLFEIIYRATGMIGAVIPYATETNPPGTLPCDGSEYLKEDYPLLWEALGERYQFTTGFFLEVEKFYTPNMEGLFIFGATTAAPYEAFSTGGSTEHTLTEEELAPHTHSNEPHQHLYNQPTFGVDIESVGVPDPTGVGNPPFVSETSSNNIIINSAGGGQPHNNMPPFVAMNYAIVCY